MTHDLDQILGMTGTGLAQYFGVERSCQYAALSGTGPVFSADIAPSVNPERRLSWLTREEQKWCLFEPEDTRGGVKRLLLVVENGEIVPPGQLAHSQVRYLPSLPDRIIHDYNQSEVNS